jgi:serine/threonine-protein kinase
MEVLQGESLGEVLDRQGRIFAERAVQTLLPVASALSAAHAKGIVHRDLKPDNIVLVTEESSIVPKVVDFGIAKLHADDVNRSPGKGVVLAARLHVPEQAAAA